MAKKSPYPEIEQEKDEEGTENSSDESNDEEFEPMPHLAEGDIVGGFDVDTGDTDTVKGLPLNPAAIPPQAPPPISAPPVPMAPKIAAAAPARPMPGMPSSVTPDDLQGYLNKQRGQINKYSPDQQYAVEQAMLKARTGPVGALSHAGATFADGIMQGVARAGNPGYAEAQDKRFNDITTEAGGAEERARKGSAENVAENQKIDSQDPGSPLSKMAQKAFGAQLQAAGLPASAVPFMSASLIGDVASKQVTLAEALARINEEGTYHKGLLENTAAQRRFDDKKLGIEHPILGAMQKAFGGGSSAPQSFDTEAAAHAAKLPPGTIVTIGGRRARID